MSHIAIYTTDVTLSGASLRLGGYALVDTAGSSSVKWNTTVALSALSATMNAAIRDAAVAAAAVAGYTVGALDNKTIISGAMGV